MDIENKQLFRDIAEEVNLGQVCYLHKETNAFFCLPNFEAQEVADKDAYAEQLTKLESEKQFLIKFEQVDGKTSFKWMEEFVGGIDDFEIQSDFMEALFFERPFASFKQKIKKHNLTSQWNALRKEKLASLFEQKMLA